MDNKRFWGNKPSSAYCRLKMNTLFLHLFEGSLQFCKKEQEPICLNSFFLISCLLEVAHMVHLSFHHTFMLSFPFSFCSCLLELIVSLFSFVLFWFLTFSLHLTDLGNVWFNHSELCCSGSILPELCSYVCSSCKPAILPQYTWAHMGPPQELKTPGPKAAVHRHDWLENLNNFIITAIIYYIVKQDPIQPYIHLHLFKNSFLCTQQQIICQ